MIGMTVQVGVHTDNITGKDAPRRDNIIYTRRELFPGNNYVMNLYGGTIWIINQNTSSTPVNLKFAGVVKANDFVLDRDNVDQWKKMFLPMMSLGWI